MIVIFVKPGRALILVHLATLNNSPFLLITLGRFFVGGLNLVYKILSENILTNKVPFIFEPIYLKAK